MAKNKPTQGARKTETLTLRLDPKIKFTIELISRIRRQTITNVIEAAIESVAFDLDTPVVIDGKRETWALAMAVSEYWSTDAYIRFFNMCFFMPDLLTFEEQRVWETVKATPEFWTEEPRYYSLTWTIEGLGHLDKFKAAKWFESLSIHADEHKDSKAIVPFDFVSRII